MARFGIMDNNRFVMEKQRSPWKFFTLTFITTWAFWVPAGFISKSGVLSTILHYLGGMMPTLVTLFLLFRDENTVTSKDYWRRLFDLKRISKGWYLVVFLTVPF